MRLPPAPPQGRRGLLPRGPFTDNTERWRARSCWMWENFPAIPLQVRTHHAESLVAFRILELMCREVPSERGPPVRSRVTLEHAALWPGGKAGLCRCEEANTYVCAHVRVHALSHTHVHTPTGNAATRGVCYVLTRRGLASKGTPGKGR